MRTCAYCKLGDHHLCSFRRCDCPHTQGDQIKSSEKYHKPKEER